MTRYAKERRRIDELLRRYRLGKPDLSHLTDEQLADLDTFTERFNIFAEACGPAKAYEAVLYGLIPIPAHIADDCTIGPDDDVATAAEKYLAFTLKVAI